MLQRGKALLYGALDLATARRGVPRVIDGITLRLAPRWSRYYPRRYDPAKAAFIASRCPTGATVVDAGAHIGLYTVLMAQRVGKGGRVIAFEPSPDTRAVLRRSVKLNKCSCVEVRAEAVGERSEERALHLTEAPCSNANSLIAGSRTQRVVPVKAITLDSLLTAEPVQLVKLDVEGSELSALRGATEMIARDHPALAIEIHPEVLSSGGVSQLWELLERWDYQVTRAEDPVSREWFMAQTGCFEIEAT